MATFSHENFPWNSYICLIGYYMCTVIATCGSCYTPEAISDWKITRGDSVLPMVLVLIWWMHAWKVWSSWNRAVNWPWGKWCAAFFSHFPGNVAARVVVCPLFVWRENGTLWEGSFLGSSYPEPAWIHNLKNPAGNVLKQSEARVSLVCSNAVKMILTNWRVYCVVSGSWLFCRAWDWMHASAWSQCCLLYLVNSGNFVERGSLDVPGYLNDLWKEVQQLLLNKIIHAWRSVFYFSVKNSCSWCMNICFPLSGAILEWRKC